MSMATRTDTQSPAPHVADSHDLIRVQGARVNNLKDVSVEIPKRRLTVFTGVSGSGKSSLVFGTIAAESQRLINETYSAFVQGFMPTLARPEVDVLDGLTTAIIVDQERMGANARSTVGTATDANAMLRILFSRLGQPHIGSPRRSPSTSPRCAAPGRSPSSAVPARPRPRKTFTVTGGMCPRCEGMGTVTDIDLTQLYDESKSLAEGAITIPGYTADGWNVRLFAESGFFDPDKPIRDYTKTELHDFLYREPTKMKIDGINLTYEGLIPKIQKSFLSKDREAMQPHIRAFVERAVTFTTCPECGGTRLNEARPFLADQGHQHRRRLRDADQRPGRVGPRPRRAVGGAAARHAAADPRLVRGDRAGLPLARPAVGHAVGRRGTAHQDDPPPRLLAHRRHLRLRRAHHRACTPMTSQRMNDLLLRLRDKGNTVLVVEHKPETIAIADHVVDLGPGAGTAGGTVCFEGTVEGLRASGTITGRHLDDRAALKETVRTPTGTLEIRGATAHNLRDVDVDIPLGVLVVVTGVAGSGKSSLVHGSIPAGAGVVSIDQGAIRGSRRSNPATYTGLLDPIRKAFAKANGVKPALFSANSEGACPTCNGAGVIYTDLGSWQASPPPARSARGSGSRHRCWTTTSAAATSARCSRCR